MKKFRRRIVSAIISRAILLAVCVQKIILIIVIELNLLGFLSPCLHIIVHRSKYIADISFVYHNTSF